jgi:hypothetical protein
MNMTPLPGYLRRRHRVALAALLALAPWAVHGPVQARDNVNWTDWTTGGTAGASGTVAFPSAGSVSVTFAGQAFSVFTGAFPEPYWGPPGTYTGTLFNNAPPNRDAIVIAGGAGTGRMTLSFSEAVVNPVLAIASLGLTNADRTLNIQTSMLFEQPFEVLSNGPNFYAGGQFTPFISVPGTPGSPGTPATPHALYGTESSGVIRFQGSFTELSWTSPLAELSDSGAVVGTYFFTLGIAPCGEYRLEPLTANAVVRLGCTAYTRGAAFDQPYELDVRGTLRAETFYTLVGTQNVALSGRTLLQQGGLIAPAAALEVNGRLENGGLVEVAGRLRTHGGSTWGSFGLVVQPLADVVVGGVATLYGTTSVNGQLKVAAGGQAISVSPLLVGGADARLDVQSGGRLQAAAGLMANSGARVIVGGELVVNNRLDIEGASLEVQSGGRLSSLADGNLLATVSNAGTLSFEAGTMRMTAGSVVNSGRLAVSGGQLALQGGVVVQNLASGRIELSGSGALGLGAAALTNQGLIDLQGSSRLELSAASLLNVGTLQTGAETELTVIGGTLDSSGTMRIGGAFFNNGNITNTGQMVFRPLAADVSQVNTGVLVNNGNLAIEAPVIGATFTNAGVLRNEGQFTIGPGAQFDNSASLFNNGQFTVDGFATISGGSLIQGPTGRLVVNGHLSTEGGLTLDSGRASAAVVSSTAR